MITGQDYIELYQNAGKDTGSNIEVFVGHNPADVLKLSRKVITGTVHTRNDMKNYLLAKGASDVCTLADILNKPLGKNGYTGYNPEFGVLGSNYSNANTLKLFPRNCDTFVEMVQAEFARRIGVRPEVMVFGDGAYRDRTTRIDELADPVVSPGFTRGRLGQIEQGDSKLKMIADTQLAGLSREEKEIMMNTIITENRQKAKITELGVTPRLAVDKMGSLADLVSGSGNKGTPGVLVHGYFDTFADNEMKINSR